MTLALFCAEIIYLHYATKWPNFGLYLVQKVEKISQMLKKTRFYGIIQMFSQDLAELYSATEGVLPILVKIKFKGKDF